MFAIVLIFLSVSTVFVSSDLQSTVDTILAETRAQLADKLPYTQLHYSHKHYDSESQSFVVDSNLSGFDGHLYLGEFKRDGSPTLSGSPPNRKLEFSFLIGVQVKYDRYTVANYTSGEQLNGAMTIFYEIAEIFTQVDVKNDKTDCSSSVMNFLPTSFSDPTVEATNGSNLFDSLFVESVDTINFYLNQTLIYDTLPTLANVVTKTNICTQIV